MNSYVVLCTLTDKLSHEPKVSDILSYYVCSINVGENWIMRRTSGGHVIRYGQRSATTPQSYTYSQFSGIIYYIGNVILQAGKPLHVYINGSSANAVNKFEAMCLIDICYSRNVKELGQYMQNYYWMFMAKPYEAVLCTAWSHCQLIRSVWSSCSRAHVHKLWHQ